MKTWTCSEVSDLYFTLDGDAKIALELNQLELKCSNAETLLREAYRNGFLPDGMEKSFMEATITRSLAEECYRIANGFQPNAMLDHTDEEAILQIENRIAYTSMQSLLPQFYPIAAHIEENYVFVNSDGEGKLNKLGCSIYLKDVLDAKIGNRILTPPVSNRDTDRAAEIIATYEAYHDEEAVASILRGIIENCISEEKKRADREEAFAACFSRLVEQMRNESGSKLGLSELIQYRERENAKINPAICGDGNI